MGNLVQQLQNNEAVLLMYLANELGHEDRMDVELLLSNDAGMRAELAQLRKDHDAVFNGLRLLDTESPLPVSAGVALRQVSRMMKQWQVDQLVVKPAPAAPRWRRMPWWVYGTASAAAAILAVVVWWGLKSDAPATTGSSNVAMEDGQDPAQDDQVKLLAMTMQGADETDRLTNAESEATELHTRTEAAQSAALPAFIPDQNQ